MSTTTIPKTMKGLTIESFAKDAKQEATPYTLRDDLAVPDVAPHQVLLKIATAGYCHTESMVVRGDFAKMMRQDLPIIPSHEPTGIVVRLGSQAEAMSKDVAGFQGSGGASVRVGDRVGSIAFANFCGKCDDCKAGKLKYCSDQDFVGVTTNGAFSEYCAVDVRSCVRLPDTLSFDAAAPLMCAGATIYTAVRDCNLKPGQSVGIIGAGSLGHLGVQFAKCMGYRTVLIDSRQAPLDLCNALPFPPDVAFNSGDVDTESPESIEKAVEACGGPCDAVIVATDVIPAFKFAFVLTKKHGLLNVVGQPHDAIPVSFWDLIFKDITIKGSLLADTSYAKQMVDLVAEKGIACKTRAYDLQNVHKMMADYALPDHAGKLVVRVSDG